MKSGFDLFEIEPVRFRIHPEGSVGIEEGRNTRQIMGAGFGGGGSLERQGNGDRVPNNEVRC